MINWKKIFELILCLKKKDKRWKRIEGKDKKQKDFLCFLIYLNSSHYNNFHLFCFIFSGPNTIALDASLGPDEVLSAALEACEVMASIFFFFLLQFPLISLFFFLPTSFLSFATLENHHLINFLPLTHHCTSQSLFYCKCQSLF